LASSTQLKTNTKVPLSSLIALGIMVLIFGSLGVGVIIIDIQTRGEFTLVAIGYWLFFLFYLYLMARGHRATVKHAAEAKERFKNDKGMRKPWEQE